MQGDIKRRTRNAKSGKFYKGARNTADVPRNGDHEHKFFAFQVKNEFEPVTIDGETLYRLVNYTYSACGCGVSTRSASKDVTETNSDSNNG